MVNIRRQSGGVSIQTAVMLPVLIGAVFISINSLQSSLTGKFYQASACFSESGHLILKSDGSIYYTTCEEGGGTVGSSAEKFDDASSAGNNSNSDNSTDEPDAPVPSDQPSDPNDDNLQPVPGGGVL